MNIYKNIIDKNEANQIENFFLSWDFPWYYQKNTTTKINNSYMFHSFYNNNQINSKDFNLIKPIVEKLKPKNILNIRANLCLRRPMKCKWHCDEWTKDLKHKTAIYYVNTNNGATEFKDKKIKCVKNTIVVFDANNKHRALLQTDTDARMVINFNYELN